MDEIEAAKTKRQLKIKSGAAQRLAKEHKSYQKEAQDLKLKLDKFIADNAEDWDVKNTRRMLEESNKMITDTATRLGTTAEELRALVVAAKKDTNLAETEDFSKAEAILEETTV